LLADTHCHLDLPVFDQDRDAAIQRALEAGVTRMLVPSLSVDSAEAVVRLSEKRPQLRAAIGVHPTECKSWASRTPVRLRRLAESESVVAIGEIGLDCYWDAAPRDVQHAVLREQLAVAGQLQLPAVIHCREREDATEGDCSDDLLLLLTDWLRMLRESESVLLDRPGVLHAFSGSARLAASVARLGFYIGVGGPVTYKNAAIRREVVASIPAERILLETDAPFLAPVPHRGRRNEPAFVALIADRIAEIKGLPLQQIASITSNNAARLFGWDTRS